MKIITININQLALQDPLKICLGSDTFYKKCSRYLGKLTKEIALFYESQGFEQVSVDSSTMDATFLFHKEKHWWKITNFLPVEMEKSSKAFLTLEFSESALLYVQALLTQLKIPRVAIS